MIEITLEPNRLKSMLSQILKLKSGSSPVDSVLVNFSPKGAKVNTALTADIMVFAEYNKDFFKSIKVDSEEEQFMVNTELVKKRLAYGFSGETITMKMDDEVVTITGEKTDDIVTQRVDEINDERITSFGTEKTSIGLIPTKNEKKVKVAFTVLVPVETFKDTLPYEHVILTTNEAGEMFLNFKDETGTRTRPIIYKNPKATVKPTKIIFNYKTFQELMSMFSGEVWLSGDEKIVVLSQTSAEFSLTYAHAPMKEEV